MRLPTIVLCSAACAVLLAACAEDHSQEPLPQDQHQDEQGSAPTAIRSILRLSKLISPTDAAQLRGCKFPRVVRGADGGVYLSWIRTLSRQRHALEFSRFDGTRFTAIRPVAEGERWFVNWADVPSLAVSRDGTIAAHWLERNGKGTFAYGIRVACSTDAGTTWHTPFWLHEDRQPTEHGFATIVPVGDAVDGGGKASFHAVWLDGRDLADQGAMTLRTRRFNATGPQSEDVLLDDRVCDCCPTDAGLDGDGNLVAVYRDRSLAEIRDIAAVRRTDGKWSSAIACGDDGWQNPG